MGKTLDFIIIGAQKSGTTTLFELLKQHNDLHFPPEKELPYFGTKKEANGWDWYMQEYFYKEKVNENKLWGTATPQYMSTEDFAGKLYEVCPNAKLIAILRNPFERAYSHYQMSLKRGKETRSYSETTREILIPETYENARLNPTENNAYFAWSEYGRILKSYLQYYPKSNILILSMAELEQTPKLVIDKLCKFLNIPLFVPNNLTKKFHQGGSKRKFAFINKIVKNKKIKSVYRKIFSDKSERTVKRWLYWIDQWNTKKGAGDIKKDEIYIKELKIQFSHDLQILEKEFSFKAPWASQVRT